MSKLLIVDDDDAVLELFRVRLADSYEIIDTTHAEEALALALEHKPDAILLDLMMPEYSGFELCHNIHTLSYTSAIPIFMVTGAENLKSREQCEKLGAKGYFQKPVDFAALKSALDAEFRKKKPERRCHARVRMRVMLKLSGTAPDGKPFEELTATEDVSATGFLCPFGLRLPMGATVKVLLIGEQERFAGVAQVVRTESAGAPWQRYAFQFVEQTSEWIFQNS
ncbi:MAG: response regulator [Candidatus Acidiferrales bacterium]